MTEKRLSDYEDAPYPLGWALEVLDLVKTYNIEDIWWRTDDKYAPITFFLNCNDLFYWACADAEVLTSENIDQLEKCINEVEKIGEKYSASYGIMLFCCRTRKMRPQKPIYKRISEKMTALFDACGPERTDG